MLGNLFSMATGLWLVLAVILFITWMVVIPIWALLDVSNDPQKKESRSVWIVMMFLCWGVTSLIYCLLGTNSRALRRITVAYLVFLAVGTFFAASAYQLNRSNRKTAKSTTRTSARTGDTQCGLAGLPEEFEVQAIGVSQGSLPTDIRLSDSYEVPNLERVLVGKTDKPIVLVLLSSHSVVWQLSLTNGAQLVGVVVSSKDASGVEGLPERVPYRVLTRDNGPNGCMPIEGHSRSHIAPINRSLEKVIGRPVEEFSDRKAGAAFQIGDVTSPVRSVATVPISAFVHPPALPQGTAQALTGGKRLSCSVGPWNSPATSCSGSVVASGIMNNSDSPSDAAAFCRSAGVLGGCCMFHLYGTGQWYLTDGTPQPGGRRCTSQGSDCNAAGPCNIGN